VIAADAAPSSATLPVSFLLVSGKSVDWALEAAAIRMVMSPAEWREWTEDPAVDVAGVLGIVKDEESELSRILLVSGARGEFPLRADGQVHLQDFFRKDVLPLPPMVACASGMGGRMVEGVVMVEGRRPVIVVRPAGLQTKVYTHTP
jgi:hypothetical protein